MTTLQVPSSASVIPSAPAFQLSGTKDEPLISLADTCSALEYKHVPDAVRDWVARLGESNLILRVDHPLIQSRGRPVTYDKYLLREPQFYKVVLGSGQPNAEAFSDWVCGEVLPCIRRHGCYPPPASPTPPRSPIAAYTNRVCEAWRSAHLIPDGYWTVFEHAAPLMLDAEAVYHAAGLPMDALDAMDISVGQFWAKFRKDMPWVAGERIEYVHVYPAGDPRGRQKAFAYLMPELPFFAVWLKKVYVPHHFGDYLRRKYGAAALIAAIPTLRLRGLNVALPLTLKGNG